MQEQEHEHHEAEASTNCHNEQELQDNTRMNIDITPK